MKEILILVGYPSSGKSTAVKDYPNHYQLSTRKLGGKLSNIVSRLEELIVLGHTKFILDDDYPNIESRKPIIEIGEKYDIPVKCLYLTTSIEYSQYNACVKMLHEFGRVLHPDEIKKLRRPDIVAASDIFAFRRNFEKPEDSEGFAKIKKIRFTSQYRQECKDNNTNAAIFIDIDAIRETKSGRMYPIDRNDIVIKPGRQAALSDLKAKGYMIIAISNQGGIGKELFTIKDAKAYMDYTNELLDGLIDDYDFCPHNTFPIQCYCRKPMPGIGVEMTWKHKLNPATTLVLENETSDKTFAKRCGFGTKSAEDYFADYEKFETISQ